jgi:2-iminobutanoate/2-iminopropanoate deaminase
MKFISIEGAKPNPGHYSPAVQKGNLLFISGQLPVNPFTGEGVQGDITEQTNQVLENLSTILETAGAKKEDVMKVTVFISDIELWGTVNSIYSQYFGDHRPARSVVPTNQLHYGFKIELEAIAFIDDVKEDL